MTGSEKAIAQGLHQAAQLAALVIEAVYRVREKHHAMKQDPRLDVSILLFVVCGKWDEDFPRILRDRLITDKRKCSTLLCT